MYHIYTNWIQLFSSWPVLSQLEFRWTLTQKNFISQYATISKMRLSCLITVLIYTLFALRFAVFIHVEEDHLSSSIYGNQRNFHRFGNLDEFIMTNVSFMGKDQLA